MTKMAVIRTGGKQYLVKENQEILVERTNTPEKDTIELETLAVFDGETALTLGNPLISTPAKAVVIGDVKADKIRVARFKAKVRYRKVKGHRAQLTKIKILSI